MAMIMISSRIVRKWSPRVLLAVALLCVASFAVSTSTTGVHTTSAMDDAGIPDTYLPIVAHGRGYYLSPAGNDGRSGTSPAEAWATFDRAWSELRPGDTLTLLDGVYYQSIHPQGVGEISKPVTVRAANDGQAIIDGQGVRIPILIERYRRSYLAIEGIVARNSSRSVYTITGDHNILRRVSGYDANTDENAHVFDFTGDHNLLEDCVASGTGRKMIVIYKGEHNIIRRCFADWRQWDGRNRDNCWPWGEGIEFYNSSYNIMENSIAYGNTSRGAISLLSQGGEPSNGNKILGTMAILSGMQADGTPMVWGTTRPQPSQYTCVAPIFEWPNYLTGFAINLSGGTLRDNLLQDILAWSNARYGLGFLVNGNNALNNNRINRATIFNNGLNNPGNPSYWGGNGAGAKQSELALFESVDNSHIEGIWTGSSFVSQNGEGARLTHRYENGTLTNMPLWPWPMEDRILSELGISVTNIMTAILSQAP